MFIDGEWISYFDPTYWVPSDDSGTWSGGLEADTNGAQITYVDSESNYFSYYSNRQFQR